MSTKSKKGLIIAIVLVVVILVVFLIVCLTKGYKDNKKNNYDGEVAIATYKSESSGYLVYLDNYVINFYDNTKVIILDLMTADVLYEGAVKGDYRPDYFIGADNNLYQVEFDEEKEISIVSKYDNHKFVKVLESRGLELHNLVYNDKVIGIYDGGNNFDNEDFNGRVYMFGGLDYQLNNKVIVANGHVCDMGQVYTLNDEKYVIINSKRDNSIKYGIFDLKENKVVLEPKYDDLYNMGDNHYWARLNGKTGVIDINDKVLVDFIYEDIYFSDIIYNKNDYYLARKNGKLALMSKSFELLTDFIIPYTADVDNRASCGTGFNDVSLFTKGNGILIETFDGEDGKGYYLNEKYELVDFQGYEYDYNYETGKIYFYKYEDKELVIYDSEVKELYRVDVSEYGNEKLYVGLNNQYLILTKEDYSHILYDVKTGKKANISYDEAYPNKDDSIHKVYGYKGASIEVNYKSDNDWTIEVVLDDETITYSNENGRLYSGDFIRKLKNNSYAILMDKEFLVIKDVK